MAQSLREAMEFSVFEEGGVRVVEGEPERTFMSRVDDANRVLEACFSSRAGCALLYAKNLTDGFFDLSTGEAGAILQHLRNYGVRLAVVCPAGSVRFSSRFGEMVAEESLRQHFGLFETRQEARVWLGVPLRDDAAPPGSASSPSGHGGSGDAL